MSVLYVFKRYVVQFTLVIEPVVTDPGTCPNGPDANELASTSNLPCEKNEPES